MSSRAPAALLIALALLLLVALWAAYGRSATTEMPTASVSLSGEFEVSLERLLDVWYPRVVDEEHGGYLTDFDAEWNLEGPQRKMIVTQARHVWTASQAAMRYPDQRMYLDIARHGFRFLRDVMWDAGQGGFYTLVTREGEPVLEGSNALKTAYGNAFGVYGLAAYAAASGDEAALEFAREAFLWLDEHSHDPEFGGYFQFMDQAGTPLKGGHNGTPPKDQNSSIHLLEAFTELYEVWPDDLVGRRLAEMLYLIRDEMVQNRQYLQLFFEADWAPVSYRDSSQAAREAHYSIDHVSVGHDIETAFLMLEAANALHLPVDTTLSVGKSMVDHALDVGWDGEVGGFYDIVYYLPGQTEASVIRDTKTWWAQAEGLNSLLLMHTLFPNDVANYFDQFILLWDYAKNNLIDETHGGWYSGGLDKEPERRESAKSQIWKGSYHTVRSVMHCVDMLSKLEER